MASPARVRQPAPANPKGTEAADSSPVDLLGMLGVNLGPIEETQDQLVPFSSIKTPAIPRSSGT